MKKPFEKRPSLKIFHASVGTTGHGGKLFLRGKLVHFCVFYCQPSKLRAGKLCHVANHFSRKLHFDIVNTLFNKAHFSVQTPQIHVHHSTSCLNRNLRDDTKRM